MKTNGCCRSRVGESQNRGEVALLQKDRLSSWAVVDRALAARCPPPAIGPPSPTVSFQNGLPSNPFESSFKRPRADSGECAAAVLSQAKQSAGGDCFCCGCFDGADCAAPDQGRVEEKRGRKSGCESSAKFNTLCCSGRRSGRSDWLVWLCQGTQGTQGTQGKKSLAGPDSPACGVR